MDVRIITRQDVYNLSFPYKLWLLIHLDFYDFLRWHVDETAIVLDLAALEVYLNSSCSIFGINNHSTFLQHLEQYRFERLNTIPEAGGDLLFQYVNKYFQPSRLDLLVKMRRQNRQISNYGNQGNRLNYSNTLSSSSSLNTSNSSNSSNGTTQAYLKCQLCSSSYSCLTKILSSKVLRTILQEDYARHYGNGKTIRILPFLGQCSIKCNNSAMKIIKIDSNISNQNLTSGYECGQSLLRTLSQTPIDCEIVAIAQHDGSLQLNTTNLNVSSSSTSTTITPIENGQQNHNVSTENVLGDVNQNSTYVNIINNDNYNNSNYSINTNNNNNNNNINNINSRNNNNGNGNAFTNNIFKNDNERFIASTTAPITPTAGTDANSEIYTIHFDGKNVTFPTTLPSSLTPHMNEQLNYYNVEEDVVQYSTEQNPADDDDDFDMSEFLIFKKPIGNANNNNNNSGNYNNDNDKNNNNMNTVTSKTIQSTTIASIVSTRPTTTTTMLKTEIAETKAAAAAAATTITILDPQVFTIHYDGENVMFPSTISATSSMEYMNQQQIYDSMNQDEISSNSIEDECELSMDEFLIFEKPIGNAINTNTNTNPIDMNTNNNTNQINTQCNNDSNNDLDSHDDFDSHGDFDSHNDFDNILRVEEFMMGNAGRPCDNKIENTDYPGMPRAFKEQITNLAKMQEEDAKYRDSFRRYKTLVNSICASNVQHNKKN